MTFTHSAVGEHRLPGGLAALVLAFALGGCAAPASTLAATPAASTAVPPSPSGGPTAIPTLGGPVPSPGTVILPTYFVTFTESRNGAATILTTPGSVCTAQVRLPDNTLGTAPDLQQPRTADTTGMASWTYPAVSAPAGVAVYTVTCSYQGRSETVQNRFTIE